MYSTYLEENKFSFFSTVGALILEHPPLNELDAAHKRVMKLNLTLV